jgi:hypothetical protein
MKNTTLPLAIFALFSFAGCATPSLTQPTRLAASDTAPPAADPTNILLDAAMVLGFDPATPSEPVMLRLFSEAKEGASEAKRKSLRFFLLGGLAIPGILRIDSLTFSEHQLTPEGLRMKVATKSSYLRIPPVCQTSNALLSVKDDLVVLQMENFYCNWAGIGNVIVAVEMQISEVGPNRLSGRWTARGNGTANGFGSGYFTLQPEPTAETTAPEVTLQNRLATSN